MKKILIPFKNTKDLPDIPKEIKQGIEVVACTHAEEVLKHALNLSRPETFMRVVGLKVVEDQQSVEVAN